MTVDHFTVQDVNLILEQARFRGDRRRAAYVRRSAQANSYARNRATLKARLTLVENSMGQLTPIG